MSTVTIIVEGRDGASNILRTVEKELHQLGGAAQAESTRTGGFFKGLAATAGGFLAANVIGGIGRQFADFTRGAIQESRDAAHGLAQTEAAIKSTGGAAGVTAQQIVDMSGSLSKLSLFSDDAIQQTSNLLLTFTQIQNKAGAGNDIFNQSTKIALDLAQAMGTDAAGGAIQLGKALNDPVTGMTALTRVGVTFDAQQKAQIKTMMASHNVLGAQKIILAELNKEFGGSALAAMKADGGFHLFQQRLADVKQTIGDALQPALQGVMGLLSGPFLDVLGNAGTALAGKLTEGINWLSNTGLPALTSAWNDVVMGFRFGGTGGAIQAIITDIGTFVPALKPVTDFIGTHFWPVWDSTANVIGIARDAFLTFKDALSGNWVDASGILPFHQAVGEVGLALGTFAGWVTDIGKELAGGDWSGALNTLTSGLTNFGTTIGTTVLTWGSQFIAWIPTAITNLQAALPGIWDTVSTWIGDQAQPILDKVSEWGTQFANWVPGAITDVKNALPGIWDTVSTWIGDQVGPILDQLGKWGQAFFDWIGPAIPKFLEGLGAFATGIGTAITQAVPVIIEKTQQWADALVDWVQNDAIPKISPAMTTFASFLQGEMGRVKTVLVDEGAKAGKATVDAMQVGWSAAPATLSKAMNDTAATIRLYGPIFNSAALIVAKGMVDTIANALDSSAPSTTAKWGGLLTTGILAIGPASGQAALGVGILIGSKLGEGLLTLKANYGEALYNLGHAVILQVYDGMNKAASLIYYAANQIGGSILNGIISGIGDLVGPIVKKINDGISGALGIVKRIYGIFSPSKVFAEQIGKPLAQGIAEGFAAGMGAVTPAMAKQMDEAAKVITAAADAVTKGTAAFPLLKSFKAPSLASIAAFTDSTKQVVSALGTVAQAFKDKWLEQAGKFLDAASKGVGIISSGVDGLTKLRTFHAPSIASITSFADTIQVLTAALGTAAAAFKDAWLTHASTFFDTASKGLGILGAGVDGLAKLLTFKAPSIAAVNSFADTTLVLVQALGTAAQAFKDAWLAHASAFEDTAGKGLALLGSGVEGLMKLSDFKAPSIAAMNAFGDTVTLLVQQLGTVAQVFKDAWLQKASQFADTAAKGIGLIGTALEGFIKLATYTGTPEESLRLFARDLDRVVVLMTQLATRFGVDGPAAAAVFGTAVGQIIAPLDDAVTAFTAINKYKGVLPAAVQLLGNDIAGVVGFLGVIAQQANTVGVAAATAFSTATGAIFDALKTALDVLGSLAKYKGVAPSQIQLLVDDMLEVVKMTGTLAYQAGAAASGALEWQNHLIDYATRIKAGVDSIASLNGLTATATIHAQTRIIYGNGVSSASGGSSGSVGGGGSSGGGITFQGRATGGPVVAGRPYVVGERSPELFVPNQNGTIYPGVPGRGDTTARLPASELAPLVMAMKEIMRDVMTKHAYDIVQALYDTKTAESMDYSIAQVMAQ